MVYVYRTLMIIALILLILIQWINFTAIGSALMEQNKQAGDIEYLNDKINRLHEYY